MILISEYKAKLNHDHNQILISEYKANLCIIASTLLIITYLKIHNLVQNIKTNYDHSWIQKDDLVSIFQHFHYCY